MTDSTVAASLRTLTLCLDQLLNRESEEEITYDGDEPAAHFFSQLESQPNFHNLEPARQARKALSSLRGEPRKIAQDLALLNKTYEEVKESLCAVYPRRPSFTLQEFYELKCTSMAEIETYYKNKVRIGLAINLPKSAIVQALSNGVPRNYGNLLKMAQPSGPEEWMCLAQQLTYEGDNTSTKAAQQRSPRQSRASSTTVDKTPPYPCRYCGGQHWHAQCQQRGPNQRTFRTFTPAVHSVEQPQRSTGPAGAVNVYHKFTPEYARLRHPLNQLLKKNAKWLWSPNCQQAFDKLKQHLATQPVLHLFQEGLPCQVYCDASTQGIAGVLKQVHPDGNIYPVQYYSRALRSYERNYTISELECLAIVECVDKFRVYLLGTKFVIYSDHHALQWLKTIKDPTGRLFRWSLRLSAHDYEVKYLKGSRQYEADLLSRNPFCGFLSTGQIKDHQGELRRDTRYILNDKDLMTITRRGVTKIIVPPSLRGTLLQRAHRDFNHPGISQMTRLIAAQYYWDGMTNDIRTHNKRSNFEGTTYAPPRNMCHPEIAIYKGGRRGRGASTTKGNDKPREKKLATNGKKLTTNEATRHTLATVILELTAALQGARSTQLEAVFRSATLGTTAARTAAVNAYKEFIPDHARLRTPLINLLKKDIMWVWDDECQKAFTNLKENLTTHPTLHLYQEGLPCQVYCNTSTFSITGVLKQVYPDGKTYTVQHFSRSLRNHERNYSDLELQCLAIVESVDNFRTCLMDRKFTIFSDHPALQWLKEIKAPSGRLFRWKLRLSRYEYEVRSINGVQQYETGVGTRIPFCGFLDAPLIQSQQSSPPGKSRVTMDHNKLRTVSRKGVLKTIVPSSLTTRLLKSVHTQHHHPNISKMTRLISAQYYWQNMTQDIAKQTLLRGISVCLFHLWPHCFAFHHDCTVEVTSRFVNVEVLLNNIPVSSFIDTGSTISLMSCSLLKQHKLKLNVNDRIKIKQVDSFAYTLGSVEVFLKIHSKLVRCKLHVVKNFSYPLLIGLDVAGKIGLIIDTKDKAVYVKGNECFYISPETHLPSVQQKELNQLLKENQALFSQHETDIGRIAVQHKIHTIEHPPISCRPYRRPLAEYDEIKRQVEELSKKGLIRESQSPWAFPVVLVSKKDGSQRMCIDYRKLNAITIDDKQPLPYIQDMFDRLHNAKYFTTLDIAWGYWHVEMHPDSVEKTAFITNDGHYEFLVMPFGLKNAPSTFQRIIQHIIGNLLWNGVCNYQDDILIYSSTFKDHIELMKKIFDKLKENNIKLKLKKCSFAKQEIRYLGHIIGHNKIKPDPEKTKAINEFPQPKTVKQVRQFLGLAGYYRKFIPKFSEIADPLTSLTRKNKLFKWTTEVNKSFQELKSHLSTDPVLSTYDPSLPCKLYTDASKLGIGAILAQIGNDNQEHVISYYSGKLLPHQQNYSAFELECFAVVQSVEYFEVYLENNTFEVITDHSALEWLFNVKKPKAKYLRWIIELSTKSMKIVHRSGSKQTHVDALSRSPVSFHISIPTLRLHQQKADLSFVKNSHIHRDLIMVKHN
ncbi:K02A2.6-like [Cordylochernes scorpioides]|uniref:RNA-directed DNA polymerase n=1 Tax=Cordylochernes scorpioides TaxID=51811 RepID=A0ABY6KD73_9ARAC|nr:K02A2.6-like [Cordylochernes scorpioides]